MAQITSREQLEAWLKDKPADWAQVIAARAALRVLPFAFGERIHDDWVAGFSVSLFRATAISWAARNFPAHEMAVSASLALLSASTAAGTFSASAAFSNYASAAFSAAASADAYAAADAHASIFSPAAAWKNIDHDCERLANETNRASVARLLTRIQLWPIAAPRRWYGAWESASLRLTALDPTYQVWIDWYNRRIEGHDAAFDIPGDIDRTHDKAILARLADATDEDFWGKGATYVNTTLQSWIDEARLTAELESVTRKLEAGAATQFGSPQARETLAAFRDKLDYALGNQPPAHAPIGHNQPPEGIDPAETPILPPAIREEAKAVLAMIDQPDRDSALETAKTLTRWSKIKSTYRHDKFSENFSGELGTSMARGIVFILTTLCLLGLAWLKAVLGI